MVNDLDLMDGRWHMEVRVHKAGGPVVQNVDEVLRQVQQKLQEQQGQWVARLRNEPAKFADLEAQIHRTFQDLADQVVAGVLAQATAADDFAQDAKKKVIEQAPRKLRSAEKRSLTVRLLGGLLLCITTLYCAPAARNRGSKGRGREGSGVYPELGVLGIQEGNSPALVREVGRQVALLPSYAISREELARRGLDLDIKEIYGIGKYAGQAALTYRRRLLEQYRAGLLPAGQEWAGKRLGVFVDGGRTKIRTTTRRQQGRGQHKKQRRRYRTDWREPKVLIICELDARGRMVPGTRAVLDGTFAGPDEVMELLAMYLHLFGAASAELVALGADGAPWVWERWDWVIQRVGLDVRRVTKTLDWCHAVHHISLALEHMVKDMEVRRRLFKKLRKWLKQGDWLEVVVELAKLAQDLPPDHEVWTELSYLDRHGEAGHLDYARFRRRGVPLGSGAIESAIRRVVNQRLKGNSISWYKENAEGMLVLRCLVLSNRWDDTFEQISASLASNRYLHGTFHSPDMTAQLKAAEIIAPPKPQVPEISASYATAA